MTGGKTALVVGATGMAACEIVPLLLKQYKDMFDKVSVIALDAKEDTFPGFDVDYFPLQSANLNSADSIAKALQDTSTDVSHIFWFLDANRPPHLPAKTFRRALAIVNATQPVFHNVASKLPKAILGKIYGTAAYMAGSGEQPRNIQWLENVFNALEQVNAPVERFVLGTGGKHYGMHLGPDIWSEYSTPFYEDKVKCPGPLSYFEMEDWLKSKADAAGFSWNIIRPTFIIGKTPHPTPVTQSFGLVLGVYACILKAKGKPLIFPGPMKNWNCRNQLTTSTKIAEVAAWAAVNKEANNQAFNVTSCGDFSWSDGTWEAMAKYFGMKFEQPTGGAGGYDAVEILGQDAEAIWKSLLRNPGAKLDLPFAQVFNNDFFDKSFSPTWDAVFSEEKLLDFGYPKEAIHEGGQAADILTRFMDELILDGYMPDPHGIATGR